MSAGPRAVRRKHRQRPGRRSWVFAAVLVALAAAGVGAIVLSRGADPGHGPPGGVEVFRDLSTEHVEHAVDYPQVPPVGGPHAPIWQDCGFYDRPIADERGVHSLEHGAVWITYAPDLPAGQRDDLRRLAADHDHVLVSPYPGLPSSVVASAWGRQLRLGSATDPRLERFIETYERGAQAPEAGAPCSGGFRDAAPGPQGASTGR